MSSRHDRRNASVTCRESKLKAATLDQHFEKALRRLRAEFEGSGEVYPRFECLTDTDSFVVPAHWPGHSAKGCSAGRH